jgi:RNA polymerase sigma-70 factor (ECF subfamily)
VATIDPERFDRTLAAARTGAEWAWREIYDALAPGIIGFLRARGAPEPEDVAGEAFVQVVRDLPRFDGDWAGFRAWVYSIARNRMLDSRRRAVRRPEHPVAEPPDGIEATGDVNEDVLARIELERVTQILARLSPDQRDVLLLRVIGDLSIEDVARVIGKRTGAVKQLQRRGLVAARKHLEGQGRERTTQ